MAKRGTPKNPSHFFFYAARPPDDVGDRIAAAWDRQGTGEPLRRDKLHMTVLPAVNVEEIPDGLIDTLVRAGDAVELPAFGVTFDRLSTWRQGGRRNHPLVLTTDNARDPEAEAVVRALKEALPPDLRWPHWQLRPHVTLAYGKGFADDLMLPEPIGWRIDHLMLIESLRGKSLHTPLARWPLRQA